MLYGALKGKLFSGYLSLLFFIACAGLSIVELGVGASHSISEYVMNSVAPFQDDFLVLTKSIGITADWPAITAYMRFMAFAYTYHYLNWFSKTKIIEWHKISAVRMRVIATIYFASLLIYAIDFRIGFVALLFLSLLHVILEFPLNVRAFVGIGREFSVRFSRMS